MSNLEKKVILVESIRKYLGDPIKDNMEYLLMDAFQLIKNLPWSYITEALDEVYDEPEEEKFMTVGDIRDLIKNLPDDARVLDEYWDSTPIPKMHLSLVKSNGSTDTRIVMLEALNKTLLEDNNRLKVTVTTMDMRYKSLISKLNNIIIEATTVTGI